MQKDFEWAVIGAGPAGIAAVGRLIDNGISAENIAWFDPAFNVGDLGAYWYDVSSNTKVDLFIRFLEASEAFAYGEKRWPIDALERNDTCRLENVVEPLRWVSDHLSKRVNSYRGHVHEISLQRRAWQISCGEHSYKSKQVILATGATPLQLSHPEVEVISLEVALNRSLLKDAIQPGESVAVFGSSHSSIVALMNLYELGVKKIVNFYLEPCKYAIQMDDWILFDNTGLKGQAAAWAREYIDGTWPDNFERYHSSDDTVRKYLSSCDKVVYTIGFKPRQDIVIAGYETCRYDPRTGILAPGLFGFGIGYPELKLDPMGNEEWQVGLWKFMRYLNDRLPIWQSYTV